MASSKLRKFNVAKSAIEKLCSDPNNVLVIHYSCESFYDIEDGASPRITSIAVKYLGSGQSRSFSIHQEAELKGVAPEDITAGYDALELAMLDKFAQFSHQHANYKWVHWNMRDGNYGFQAIAHRHRVLGGQPTEIRDDAKADLSSLLYDFLGKGYAEHPRFQKLLEHNDMVPRNFLTGAEEAAAFEAGEYVKLHQSTLCKADTLSNLLHRAEDDDLKCANGFFKRRGISFRSCVEWTKDHPVVGLAGILAAFVGLITAFSQLFGD